MCPKFPKIAVSKCLFCCVEIQKIHTKIEKSKKAFGTHRSNDVSDRSTEWAHRCLTWQIGRDVVFSPGYGRIHSVPLRRSCCFGGSLFDFWALFWLRQSEPKFKEQKASQTFTAHYLCCQNWDWSGSLCKPLCRHQTLKAPTGNCAIVRGLKWNSIVDFSSAWG